MSTKEYVVVCKHCHYRNLLLIKNPEPEKETSDSETTPINITVNTGDTVPLSLYKEREREIFSLHNRYRDLQEAHIKLKKELAMFEQANDKLKRDIFLLRNSQEV